MMLSVKFLVVFLSWGIIVILLFCNCKLFRFYSYLQFLISSPPDPSYSFIVIGAGSAGSVVAGRLAQGGHTVLLLEAGGHAPWLASVPAVVGTLQLGDLDWQYKTVKQGKAGLALGGEEQRWPRGKVMGGNSIINYMLYVRGHRGDYDEWDRLGAEGWDWDSVLPYFKKSENWVGEYEGAAKYHGVGGVMGVSPVAHMDPITRSFLDGGREMGYKVGDINGDEQDSGFTISQTTTMNGKRQGTFEAFAEPFVGKNLTVLDHSHVTRIQLEDGVAVGVKVLRHGVAQFYRCTREVVVSAGAVGSPHLLMLSGIGDQENLQKVGIPVLYHLPGVGANLQDHLSVLLNLDVREGMALNPALNPVSSLARYLLRGSGPLSHAGVDAMAQVRTNLSRDPRPDVQLILNSISLATDMGLMLKQNLGLSEKAWRYHGHGVGKDTASILTILSRPKSRGTIRLFSRDPLVHPVIDPNYLSHEDDLQTLVAGLKLAKRLAETEALKAAGAKEWSHRTDPYCGRQVYDSEAYWRCYVRHWSNTIYHPVGTCAIGTVTDNRLRVKGVRGLRVADASVMPKIVGGNTNAPAIMIGEKAADMILEDAADMIPENDEISQDAFDTIVKDVSNNSIGAEIRTEVNKEEL